MHAPRRWRSTDAICKYARIIPEIYMSGNMARVSDGIIYLISLCATASLAIERSQRSIRSCSRFLIDEEFEERFQWLYICPHHVDLPIFPINETAETKVERSVEKIRFVQRGMIRLNEECFTLNKNIREDRKKREWSFSVLTSNDYWLLLCTKVITANAADAAAYFCYEKSCFFFFIILTTVMFKTFLHWIKIGRTAFVFYIDCVISVLIFTEMM